MLSSHKAYYARLGLHALRDPAHLPLRSMLSEQQPLLWLLLLLKWRGKKLLWQTETAHFSAREAPLAANYERKCRPSARFRA